MVTYLPTILMNIINQATNYITGDDKYSLIYTINITCMMVLASVYLSVSSSLPSTANIKPVEVWLLFNLAYPVLVMLSNIVIQVILFKDKNIFKLLSTGNAKIELKSGETGLTTNTYLIKIIMLE